MFRKAKETDNTGMGSLNTHCDQNKMFRPRYPVLVTMWQENTTMHGSNYLENNREKEFHLYIKKTLGSPLN